MCTLRFIVKGLTSLTRLRLWRDTRAASAVEYGLILALIVLTMLVTFVEVASRTTAMWHRVGNRVEATTP